MLSTNELKILDLLRQDPRIKMTDLAKNLNIPKSTVFDIFNKLKEKGLHSPRLILDFDKLGYSIRVFIAVSVSADSKGKVLIFLKDHPNINSLFAVGSGHDYLFEAVFGNQKQHLEFMRDLDFSAEILEKQVFYTLDDIHRERFTMMPQQSSKISSNLSS